MKNLFLVPPIMFLITACSTIEQPIASRPLVEQNFTNKYLQLPENSWDPLANSVVGQVVNLSSQQVKLDKLYFSATGKQCRQLFFPNDLLRIACRDAIGSQWFLVKPVISEYIEPANAKGRE